MSRIARFPIEVPNGVEVNIASGEISVKGPLGIIARAADPNVAVEKSFDLLLGAADGGGGGNDFGTDTVLRAQEINGGFVESGKSPERTGNEMKLVLNDEFGASGSLAGSEIKEVCGLFAPRQACEFVGGGNDKRGTICVNVLIHNVNGQPFAECTSIILAADNQFFGRSGEPIVAMVERFATRCRRARPG